MYERCTRPSQGDSRGIKWDGHFWAQDAAGHRTDADSQIPPLQTEIWKLAPLYPCYTPFYLDPAFKQFASFSYRSNLRPRVFYSLQLKIICPHDIQTTLFWKGIIQLRAAGRCCIVFFFSSPVNLMEHFWGFGGVCVACRDLAGSLFPFPLSILARWRRMMMIMVATYEHCTKRLD